MKRSSLLSWKRIETVITVALLLFVAYRFWPQISTLVGVGGPVGQAPQFALETLDGHPVSLADYDGQVVLVNFWATWCRPCRLEMPGFQKLYRDKADQGFVVLGISTDRGDVAGVEAFLAERGIEYPVAMETREVNLAFGGISAIPTSFLIDRNGVIRHRIFGFMPPPALRVAVNRLLEERP
ncbi:MAG: TlpA disulfide reductase family protein [Gemmatimonadota bacterium]|nr:MAG: TlpA disulfide reductase family protein [Gemmatimonadota bacterium]